MIKFLKNISLLCYILLLTGCSPIIGKVSTSQLEADIPQGVTQITVDSQEINLSVESLEITKRSTEDICDEIYCDLVLSNEEYQVSCVYACEYKYYDTGGWCLEYYWLDDISISCLEEVPEVLEFQLEKGTIYYYDEAYDVQSVECRKVGENTYEFLYEIKGDGEYRHDSGIYKYRYSLVPASSTGYSWEREQREREADGIITTWDIVGTYIGEGGSNNCKIVIDSYNQETNEVHIASYEYEEDYPWIGGNEKINLKDITITADVKEPPDYDESELFLSIRVSSGECHFYTFEKNRFVSTSMVLERSN